MGLCLLLCEGYVCYCVGVVFVIMWGLCLLLCGGCVCYCMVFFIKYINFPCMLHCHAAILHALFTNYMLFISILYTFNILLSI